MLHLFPSNKQLLFNIESYLSKRATNKVRMNCDRNAILISGCDSGIGLELAKNFHEKWICKIICGFLNLENSKGYQDLLKLKNSDKLDRLQLFKLDLTSNDDVRSLQTSIDNMRSNGIFDNLIALINNAGVMAYGEFDWLTWEQIEKQIDINFTGTIRLTRAMLPSIIACKGKIINVSSVNDKTVFPGISIYSGTKSAISTFSRGLAYEMRKFDVHVVTIRLGDFARLTNIMSGHQLNQKEMWNEMSIAKRDLYEGYFQNFNSHLMKNYGMTSPKNFESSPLFNDFETAILSKNPPSTITCAPLLFRIFYFIIELMPVSIQYRLLDFLIEFGFKWKPPKVSDRTQNKND